MNLEMEESRIEEIAMATLGIVREKPMFEESHVGEDDMERINQFAAAPLRPEQIYVRSMYLCSSQPCVSDGCQFTREALDQIAERVAGLSVLTGHDRTSLPLARFYKAQVVQRDSDENGVPVFFVRAWFYWLRDTTGARDLLLNIDGGIYREVSLAWKYDSWRCSICHTPNGLCGHRVGSSYNGRPCFRRIERITDLLEGSLVYKSADKNTFLTGARVSGNPAEEYLLLAIGEKDDPLFPLLERSDALLERRDLSEWEELLSQGVDSLWIRNQNEDFIRQTAGNLLAENGVCLGEIDTQGLKGNSKTGAMVSVIRIGQSAIEMQPLIPQEDDRDTIWTV